MTELDVYAVQRLSRAATDLGHYNLGKLLTAAVTAYLNRTLYAESLPKTDRALAEAVATIEPQLRAADLDPQLLESIHRACEIVASQRMILYEDAPPIWVCRACGQVALRTLPDHCPHCGGGSLIFQAIPAAFYLEPEPVPLVMSQLARTPDWLDATLTGFTEEQAARQVEGIEGAWSLREAAGHILDTQNLIAQRVELFFTQAAPNLNAMSMWGTVEAARLSTAEIATEFRLSREAMVHRLRSASSELWARVGQHSEFGPVTLQQQCTYFAKHEHWHMAQITRIWKKLNENLVREA
jgi:uncharacterized damage-inducible protein DinB